MTRAETDKAGKVGGEDISKVTCHSSYHHKHKQRFGPQILPDGSVEILQRKRVASMNNITNSDTSEHFE